MKLKLISLMLLSVLALTGCTSTENTPTDTTKDSEPSTISDEKETDIATSDEIVIKMTAFQYDFEPNTIRVKEGDKVTLNITSTDVEHGFSISAYNINESLPPNEMVTITFVADKKGEFPFVCSVFCGTGHSEMRGTLIVE